jgi:hypothetical protein
MTRWFSRFRRARVVAEAQIDYRDGLLEARAERIAELERDKARLMAELATYKAAEFVRTALRHRRRLAEEQTGVYPAKHWRKP